MAENENNNESVVKQTVSNVKTAVVNWVKSGFKYIAIAVAAVFSFFFIKKADSIIQKKDNEKKEKAKDSVDDVKENINKIDESIQSVSETTENMKEEIKEVVEESAKDTEEYYETQKNLATKAGFKKK